MKNKRKQALNKNNKTRSFTSIMKDIVTLSPEDFESSKIQNNHYNHCTPLSNSKPVSVSKPDFSVSKSDSVSNSDSVSKLDSALKVSDSTIKSSSVVGPLTYSTPLVTTIPVTCTKSVTCTKPIDNQNTLISFSSAPLTGTGNPVTPVQPAQSYQNFQDKAKKMQDEPDYGSCVPTSYPIPVIPQLPPSKNGVMTKKVPPPPGFPPLESLPHFNEFWASLFKLDDPSVIPSLAASNDHPCLEPPSVIPSLTASNDHPCHEPSLIPSIELPSTTVEPPPIPHHEPSSKPSSDLSSDSSMSLSPKPANNVTLSSEFSAMLVNSHKENVPEPVKNWLKRNNMLLLKNHTHTEAMMNLIAQKNENVKHASIVTSDIHSFNSHTHDIDLRLMINRQSVKLGLLLEVHS